MIENRKSQIQILEKLGIESLNAMQQETAKAISSEKDTLLLSPTGTGKTLAFLLPILKRLDPNIKETQCLIIAPSRELAIQLEQVALSMGSGFKINVVYGGRSGSKDKVDLKHPPAILIGTPGRIADHLRRDNIAKEAVEILVLDEFDKSLEVGFETEMKEIVQALTGVKQKILTSATQGVDIPDFVGLKNLEKIDYLNQGTSQLKIQIIRSEDVDKAQTLVEILKKLEGIPGIVFCNLKETLKTLSADLTRKGIAHGVFYGGLEQRDRELALLKFRNGTHSVILATDLAARGLDIPDLGFILHYQLPPKEHEFVHRNGRTARMNRGGTAYVLLSSREKKPSFVKGEISNTIEQIQDQEESKWVTLHLSSGRRDKISKGDIAGFFFKMGQLQKNELGIIEIQQKCAYVAVAENKVADVLQRTNNQRLKKNKIRVSVVD